MSPGEVICDYKGKYASLKVLPFEDASREVSLEGTLVSEYQGRLSGTDTRNGILAPGVRWNSDP